MLSRWQRLLNCIALFSIVALLLAACGGEVPTATTAPAAATNTSAAGNCVRSLCGPYKSVKIELSNRDRWITAASIACHSDGGSNKGIGSSYQGRYSKRGST